MPFHEYEHNSNDTNPKPGEIVIPSSTLLLIPGIDGSYAQLMALAASLSEINPTIHIFFYSYPRVDRTAASGIDNQADALCNEILKFFSQDVYTSFTIAGYSYGALLAFLAADKLQSFQNLNGFEDAHINFINFDSASPQYIQEEFASPTLSRTQNLMQMANCIANLELGSEFQPLIHQSEFENLILHSPQEILEYFETLIFTSASWNENNELKKDNLKERFSIVIRNVNNIMQDHRNMAHNFKVELKSATLFFTQSTQEKYQKGSDTSLGWDDVINLNGYCEAQDYSEAIRNISNPQAKKLNIVSRGEFSKFDHLNFLKEDNVDLAVLVNQAIERAFKEQLRPKLTYILINLLEAHGIPYKHMIEHIHDFVKVSEAMKKTTAEPQINDSEITTPTTPTTIRAGHSPKEVFTLFAPLIMPPKSTKEKTAPSLNG